MPSLAEFEIMEPPRQEKAGLDAQAGFFDNTNA